MRTKKKKSNTKNSKKNIEQYEFDSERKNIPQVGLVNSKTDKITNKKSTYEHNPHIDPFLSWSSKVENQSLEIIDTSLHIHERIDPLKIIKRFEKKTKEKKNNSQNNLQLSFFDNEENDIPLNKAIDFYSFDTNWSNRLILGDSLFVMNSLLKKEGYYEKVQTIFIDPPYGIKYNSNFQPFVSKNNNLSKGEEPPTEVELIKAFRDTWELDIHSYLNYLRNRLTLCHKMLKKSGSIFFQINDTNLSYCKILLDEVFGSDCFLTIIPFKKKGSQKGDYLPPINDYIIWYSKTPKSEQAKLGYKIKFHELYEQRSKETNEDNFNYVEIDKKEIKIIDLTKPDGTKFDYKNNFNQILKDYPSAKLFRPDPLQSGGIRKNQSLPFEYKGKTYHPNKGSCWKTTVQTDDGSKPGMQALAEAGRLFSTEKNLYYKRYFDDFEFKELSNWWDGFGGASNPVYVVQTNEKIVERCILMTSDPGDIVFDPTCGSGTTAVVSERYGRKWITCDTSRVSIALTKRRLISKTYDYYSLFDKSEGINSGLKYKQAKKTMLSDIANQRENRSVDIYNKPEIDSGKHRVTGPFTVEALPCVQVKSFNDDQNQISIDNNKITSISNTKLNEWLDELKSSGINSKSGKKITFNDLSINKELRFIDAMATSSISDKNTIAHSAIVFGPEFGPIDQRQIEEAINEILENKIDIDFLIFCSFHYDPEASKDIDQIKDTKFKILKCQMNTDMLTADLKTKKQTSQSYWLIGQPDIEIIEKSGKYSVMVKGFDYYDPITKKNVSKGIENIAMWFLDEDYDEKSICPDQIFFPDENAEHSWKKLSKTLKNEIDEKYVKYFSGNKSHEFSKGNNSKIAVKIVDDRGIESLIVKEL